MHIYYYNTGIHKRMMRFQKWIRNLFLNLHGHNIHRQRQQPAKFLSMLSSDTRGRPGLLPLHKHPVSTNCQYHLLIIFLCGASFWNRARNSRCTVITDLDTWKEKLGQLPPLMVYVVPVKGEKSIFIKFWNRAILFCIPCRYTDHP
jgi:hypothetical protein